MTPRDQVALAAAGVALALAAVGGWLAVSPLGGAPPDAVVLDPFDAPLVSASPSAAPNGVLLVDVEGAVMRPGMVQVPSGARVADAIAAAGGYGPDVDLLAAMQAINLAAPLSDGQQVFVPIQGVAGGSNGGGGGGGGGLVNLNTATPEALDALPGIGPVTVGKIVAARSEQPFGTLEELVERDVMTNAQLDGIRDLVTVG